MDWRDQVISDVGHGMGVEGLDFSGTGVIQFEFERRGNMYIEAKESGVLFYLIRNISRHDCLDQLNQALRLAHYSKTIRYPLQVGLKGDEELFLCIFLTNENFNRPNIEAVIQLLAEQFDKIVAV